MQRICDKTHKTSFPKWNESFHCRYRFLGSMQFQETPLLIHKWEISKLKTKNSYFSSITLPRQCRGYCTATTYYTTTATTTKSSWNCDWQAKTVLVRRRRNTGRTWLPSLVKLSFNGTVWNPSEFIRIVKSLRGPRGVAQESIPDPRFQIPNHILKLVLKWNH